jgi:hypothetical protein
MTAPPTLRETADSPVRYLHAVQKGEDMTAWIDLLILIPSWLGVFGVIATILAEVVG